MAGAGEGEGQAAFRAVLVEAEALQLNVAERGRTRRMLAWGWRLEVGGWGWRLSNADSPGKCSFGGLV